MRGSPKSRDRDGETVTPENRLDDPSGTLEYPELTKSQLARLRAYAVAEEVRAGDVLYRPGDVMYDLIVVDSAAVDVVLEAEQDEERVFVTHDGPGRFIGELNLLTGDVIYVTVRVATSGTLHRIASKQFRRLMAEDAELSDIILSAFTARREKLQRIATRSLEIIGEAASAGSFALRSYVSRAELPHMWVAPDSASGAALMTAHGISTDDLPAVIARGEVIRNATPGLLANDLGLSYRQRSEHVDLTVIGAGPAGLAAAVYGASEGLATVLLDAVSPGGQAAASSRIENYLGFPNGLSGADLTGRSTIQALKFGAQVNAPCEVVRLDRSSGQLRVMLADGSEIATGAVILATGARYRSLPLERWGEFEGAGIYYAATELEARACGGQAVTVVGGANSAGQAAIFMASRGSDVTVVVRGSDIGAGMSWYLVERLLAHPSIRILTSTEVTQLSGTRQLESITLTNSVTGHAADQPCSGLFCFIGARPATAWLGDVLLDEHGFVCTDVRISADSRGPEWAELGRTPLPFETSVPGVFAAGDVRTGSMKRVAAAVGEGASAAAGHLMHRNPAASRT